MGDARRIVRGVSKERGPSAEYPDVHRATRAITPSAMRPTTPIAMSCRSRRGEVAKTRLCRDTRSHLVEATPRPSPGLRRGRGQHTRAASTSPKPRQLSIPACDRESLVDLAHSPSADSRLPSPLSHVASRPTPPGASGPPQHSISSSAKGTVSRDRSIVPMQWVA
jgi:hypothetical protein